MNLIIYFTVYSSERSVRMRVTPQYLPFAKSFLVQMRNLGIVVVFIPIMESVCAIAVSKKSSSTVYFVKVFLMTMIMAICGLSYTFSENIWNLKELRITSLFVRKWTKQHLLPIWVILVKIALFVPYTTFWKIALGSSHGGIVIKYLVQIKLTYNYRTRNKIC